jgi:signal transduction histidine kinase
LSTAAEGVLLAQAERSILRSLDARAYLLIFIAADAAIIAAIIVARRLSRPASDLARIADDFTRGDRAGRAAVSGPREIASLSMSFNHLADVLDEEDHLRRRLVADISHELRNPITVATAQTEAMLSGALPSDSAHLEVLLADLQFLGLLVDDMQELSIAESGRWRYNMGRVDLSELIVQNAARAGQRIGPGVEVVVVGAGEPAVVYGDRVRLDQVLRNILGNAKRHTASGSITLSVEHALDHATVRVTDTGEGISPEDLPLIFERFYRTDTARTTATGGAGLGLSIARAIIRDHRGSVFAESEPGRGTVIGFTLPLERRSHSRSEAPVSPGTDSAAGQAHNPQLYSRS